MPQPAEAMAHMMLWFLLPAAATPLSVAAAAGAVAPSPSPAAPRRADCHRCGDVDVPYTFGIGDPTCNYNLNPPRLHTGTIELLDISLEVGEMRVLGPLRGQLLISTTRNEFTATGCSTFALLSSSSYYTSCISYWCTGLGCCQISIPGNLTDIQVSWGEYRAKTNSTRAAWNPCSYGFIAEKNWYEFRRKDLVKFVREIGNRNMTQKVPLVLDWAIRDDESCPPSLTKNDGVFEQPKASPCVSPNSHCVNASQGPGYLCNCSKGYTGNHPYVNNGCKNINECELRKLDPIRYEELCCCGHGSTCVDTDDGKSERGCEPIFPDYAIGVVANKRNKNQIYFATKACLFNTNFTTSHLFILFLHDFFYDIDIKRFFDKNGGVLKGVGITIFTQAQLKKITNGYEEAIGQGAFGKVYKGTVNTIHGTECVAVKRASVRVGALPQAEFVNEITFQFKISHPNLSRLVGCCLETDVPMLFFEFVPKGSLYDILHDHPQQELSLKQRLDIALGSAKGLEYMHCQGGQNHYHIHGDVNLSSPQTSLQIILCLKSLTLGHPRFMSTNSKYVRSVSCDMNYIDPVYFQTECFTMKSDVYSFGVVLLELITRKKLKYDNTCLTVDFKKSYKDEAKRRNIYDTDIISGNNHGDQSSIQCLDKVAALAVRCLSGFVDERLTMAEVVEELENIKENFHL
ncbi:hypothetical protein BS78_05G102300 [Paspalum vaginatum]|nr:hypothetical protein BS78_05G102300 [Paspalum vaginatum]